MQTINPTLEKILKNQKYKENDRVIITQAFAFAKKAHLGQKRISGEDYIAHPLRAAEFLAELGLDASTIAACLLHDTIEDTKLTLTEIKKEFGEEIAFLVEGVTKINRIEYSEDFSNKSHINSLKKMLFAMAEDIRVILIKLADRLHNMETLSYLKEEKQKKNAYETLEIFAPIAGRLGMGNTKGRLEDLAFPFVYPKEYSSLVKKVENKYKNSSRYIERTMPLIKRKLADAKIPVLNINSRIKHYYSLYQKLKRRDMDLNKIFDLVAIRIIVPDVKSCYEALGTIHKFYKPVPGLIKDYISMPKPNGYKSLHTTVFCEKGKIVEIQIRTPEMHEYAENGIASHWAYSESGKTRVTLANKKETQWVSELKNFLKGAKTGEDLSGLKIDFFKNRIFALTPKGEVKDLPEGATPIDFAYAIHTDVGHSIKGALVNNKIVSFEYELKNGDVVQILKSKKPNPSLGWLNIVKTAEAKNRIRSWFRQNESKKSNQ